MELIKIITMSNLSIKQLNRKCIICNCKFNTSDLRKKWCSPNCGYEYSKQLLDKTKSSKVELKKIAISLKTLGEFKKDLQIEVNKIVRLIDEKCNCISCDIDYGHFQAGHYRSVGGWDNLRFNLHNNFRQCAQCNNPKSGNLVYYREGVVKTFGESQMAYMDDLNVIYPSVKLNKDELAERTKIAKKAVKELIELNRAAKLPRSADDRIELRKKYNTLLNIYN